MHITVVPKNQPVVIANLAKTCGKFGVIVQSLDSNGQIFIGTDPTTLNGQVDASGNAPDGLQIQRQAAVTNMPAMIPLAPFAGTLYAVNVGAAASVIAVFIWPLE